MKMYIINSVEVKGFWNRFSIKSDLKEDVTIFIGKNGSGKTTFINLIEAALSGNIEILMSTKFEEITIYLKKNKSNRKITVIKKFSNYNDNEIVYRIGVEKFVIPLPSTIQELNNFKSGRVNPRINRFRDYLKKELNKLLNISYLSVSREKIVNESIEDRTPTEIYNAIDNRLVQLINELKSYQLEIETEVTKLSKKFQEDVLKTMLFDENLDYIDINKFIDIDPFEIKKGLAKAYNALGLLDIHTEENIGRHVEALKKSVEKINSTVTNTEDKTPIYPNDVTPLTLVKRTEKIISLSTTLENDRKRIYSKIDDYINALNDFHENKYFSIQGSKNGGLEVYNLRSNLDTSEKVKEKIEFSNLSSGEKQLLIILTEALLQRGKETVFIADEPELSLHIEWQRKIIPSINQLNPNSQIIVATHSPEVVGKFRNNVINMEKIIYG